MNTVDVVQEFWLNDLFAKQCRSGVLSMYFRQLVFCLLHDHVCLAISLSYLDLERFNSILGMQLVLVQFAYHVSTLMFKGGGPALCF